MHDTLNPLDLAALTAITDALVLAGRWETNDTNAIFADGTQVVSRVYDEYGASPALAAAVAAAVNVFPKLVARLALLEAVLTQSTMYRLRQTATGNWVAVCDQRGLDAMGRTPLEALVALKAEIGGRA